MFNLKGPQVRTRGTLVVRGPQFEKRRSSWGKGWGKFANLVYNFVLW